MSKDRTDNEKATASFDVQLQAILKSAKKNSDQLWPAVINQLEIAQQHVRMMMHPEDVR